MEDNGERQDGLRSSRRHRGKYTVHRSCAKMRRVSGGLSYSQLAIETLSTVCATDFKASEIEIGISSTSSEEPIPAAGKEAIGLGMFRQMGEEERGEWLVRVGEKD